MPTLSVELTPEAEQVWEQIRSRGIFANESDYMNETLLGWDWNEYERKCAKLRERLAEGIAQCERREFAPLPTVDELLREAELELEAEHG